MAAFAINTVGHHDAIPPAELARWAERSGFDALYYGEHTHIPVKSHIPGEMFPGGLPEFYKQFYDPFIALAAAAAATRTLKIGLAVCLVAQHNAIALAKKVATLDRISEGRLLFGIGAGWNREEMADFGVVFEDRWTIVREKVLAMREIWTQREAEFHGEFVEFDPVWCWPKPVRAAGPPVIMGAGSKWTPQRIAEYCDGWMPIDGAHDVETRFREIRSDMERAGRAAEELDLTVITGHASEVSEQRIGELLDLGFQRISFFVAPAPPNEQWLVLESRAELVQRLTRVESRAGLERK